jgi:hypothetical protein
MTTIPMSGGIVTIERIGLSWMEGIHRNFGNFKPPKRDTAIPPVEAAKIMRKRDKTFWPRK